MEAVGVYMKAYVYDKPLNDKSLIGDIGIITRKNHWNRNKYVYVADKKLHCLGCKACISPKIRGGWGLPPFASLSEANMSLLREGDIVKFLEDGVTVLWENGSKDNALMLTESCNCKCIMCPQPTRAHDRSLVADVYTILDLLKGVQLPAICITGGEPTLIKKDFISILQRCVIEHSEAEINILTNGKTFADIDFTKQVMSVVHNNSVSKIVFCVSLHSDVDFINDIIVGVKGSRDATEQGIYNLAQCGAHIEIRHVITKKNYTRLAYFAEYIYNYFPFCCHYAFMGMEVHGDAEKNMDEIYVPPMTYNEELRQAITFLKHRSLPVSVYNIPLCMCHTSIRDVATQSISQWKNIFHEKCAVCKSKEVCSGFFATSSVLPVQHINPITTHNV